MKDEETRDQLTFWQEARPVLKWIWPQVTDLPSLLDWLLQFVEYVLVFSVALFVVFLGIALIADMAGDAVRIVATLGANWKALILILVPLFFRPIREFLLELEEVMGAKRRKQESTDAKKGKSPPKKKRAKGGRT